MTDSPEPTRPPLQWFLYRLEPPRPDYAQTMTDAERAVMAEHAAYWTRVVGRCLVFSPVADPAGVWGLAVVGGADEAEARTLAEGDPAVTSGTCTFALLSLFAPVTRD